MDRTTFERKQYGRLCLVGWGQRIRRDANPPKNSLPTVALARELKYDAVEIDIRISADGVPVLAHDVTLTNTDGDSLVVAESDFATLSSFQLGTFDGKPVYIPTLEEALRMAGPLDVQLDTRIAPNQVQILRDAVDAAGFDPCCLQFCVYRRGMADALVRIFPESVLMWKPLPPEQPITRETLEKAKAIGMDGIMARFPREEHDFESLMALARPLGMRVLVYIIGREKPYPEAVNAAFQALQDTGVTYVTTIAAGTEGFRKVRES